MVVMASGPTNSFIWLELVNLVLSSDQTIRKSPYIRISGLFFTYLAKVDLGDSVVAEIRRHIFQKRKIFWALNSLAVRVSILCPINYELLSSTTAH